MAKTAEGAADQVDVTAGLATGAGLLLALGTIPASALAIRHLRFLDGYGVHEVVPLLDLTRDDGPLRSPAGLTFLLTGFRLLAGIAAATWLRQVTRTLERIGRGGRQRSGRTLLTAIPFFGIAVNASMLGHAWRATNSDAGGLLDETDPGVPAGSLLRLTWIVATIATAASGLAVGLLLGTSIAVTPSGAIVFQASAGVLRLQQLLLLGGQCAIVLATACRLLLITVISRRLRNLLTADAPPAARGMRMRRRLVPLGVALSVVALCLAAATAVDASLPKRASVEDRAAAGPALP